MGFLILTQKSYSLWCAVTLIAAIGLEGFKILAVPLDVLK